MVCAQKFFDLYSLDEIHPAPFSRDDLDDIVWEDGKPIFKPTSRFLCLMETTCKQANCAYLACVSYVDYCLGVLFTRLKRVPTPTIPLS